MKALEVSLEVKKNHLKSLAQMREFFRKGGDVDQSDSEEEQEGEEGKSSNLEQRKKFAQLKERAIERMMQLAQAKEGATIKEQSVLDDLADINGENESFL